MGSLNQSGSILRMVIALTCVLILTACKPVAEASTQTKQSAEVKPSEGTASVMTDSVNYMHERGVKYTLYDLSQTPSAAIGGSIVEMLATGGDKGCCISLPRKWHPGLKVRLNWDEADRQRTYPEKYTRDFEIPRYDEPADLYVVFYPKNEVELVVSKAEPGHPSWRGRIKQTPWENCLAHNERKVCKIALPKQFDTASSQGFCTYTQSADYPKENFNGQESCAWAMHECMQDYEDEPFCKGILWGPRKK